MAEHGGVRGVALNHPAVTRAAVPPTRALLALALGVLAWGALPYLPVQIDDAFITFAYAHNIVEHGEIAWNTGVRVEGYSSPLHLALMVLGCAAGLDLSVAARLLSLGCAVATLAWLASSRHGAGRGWLVLALAAWQPFQFWAVGGLETMLATVIGAVAWPLALGGRREWALGCLGLVAYALARPEGAAWLLAGLALRWRHPRDWSREDTLVATAFGAFLAYHAARVSYFGALLPTPWLVKIVAIDQYAAGGAQLGWELLSSAAVLIVVVGWRRRVPLFGWFPLALQAALLLRAGGDWMGNARFLVPGVVASAAAAFALGQAREARWRWLALALLPITFLWAPSGMRGEGPQPRDRWFLLGPLAALRAPWPVPLAREVDFLARRIPPGAGAEISDVGLPGNLDDVRVWDGAGLTDRVVAEIIAADTSSMSEPLKARFDDPDDIWCIRYALGDDGTDPGDDWLRGTFPEGSTAPDDHRLFWRCRPGGEPGSVVVVERWRRLLERYPVQDGLRLGLSRALINAGDIDEAWLAASGATWVGADAPGWAAFATAIDAEYAPGRGWPLNGNGALATVSLPAEAWSELRLSLDADDPGDDGARAVVQWVPACGEPTSIDVHGTRVSELPACDNAAPRSLRVEFTNDDYRPPLDRNLYVTLVPTSAR